MIKSIHRMTKMQDLTPMPSKYLRNAQLVLVLLLTVLFDLSLLLYRNLHLTGYWRGARHFTDLLANGQKIGFLFLIWNLFLAWIPYALSLIIRQSRSDRTTYPLLLIWLLFFPNAPYIITDFLHLHHRPPVPMWYDLLVFFSFAWTGLIFGYLSLMNVHEGLVDRWGRPVGRLLVGGVLILSGFGIYIGRFLRWNSWDILAQPHSVIADIFSIFLNPAVHWPAVGAGILLSVMLLLGYATLRAIRP